MKATMTFAINFIARITKADRQSASLYVRITVNGDRKEISLKEQVHPKNWDSAREIVKGKTSEVKSTNEYIENVRFRIKEKYRSLETKGLEITADILKQAYLGNQNPQKLKHTLIELVKFHTKIESEKLKPGTMKNYIATEEYLKRFINHKFKTVDIILEKLNYEFIAEFEYFIRNYPLKEHDPCKGNGVMKHLERLKKMTTWSVKLQWLSSDPFTEYKLNLKKYKRSKLTLDELLRIENMEVHSVALANIKDLFLFSCYTGLSYADVITLKPDHFEKDINGYIWCKIYRQKSAEQSRIPVLTAAQFLLGKYKNHPKAITKGTIFPYVSNQEVNRNLKIIGEICGITRYMSFHLARHTFATVVTLKNGVPLETVSKMLGHTKLSTTQIYAEVDEDKIATDMEKVECRMMERRNLPKPFDL